MATKPLSVSDILLAVEEDVAAVKKAGEDTSKLRAKQAELATKQASVLEEAGEAQKIVARQQGVAVLEVQQENLKAASAVGVTEASNALLDLLAAQKQANDRLLNRTAKIRELRGSTPGEVGLASWIGRNFQAAFQEKALEGEVKEAAAISTAITNTHKALQETFVTNKGKAIANTAETVAAQTRLAATEAQLQALGKNIEAIGYNAAAIKEAKDATLEQRNIRYAGNQQVLAARQDARAAEGQAMDRERFEWQKDEAAYRKQLQEADLADKQEAKRLEDNFVAKVNAGRAVLNKPLMTPDEQSQVLRSFRTGQNREDLSLWYRLGDVSLANGGKQVFGNSPAAAAAVVLDPAIDAQINAAQEETRNLLTEARQRIPQDIRGSKDKNQLNQAFNQQVKTIVAEQFGTAKGVDGVGQIMPGSPFDVGDIGSLEAGYLNAGSVRSLPLVTKVLRPAADAKVSLDKPTVVLDLVRAAIKNGTVNSSQAAAGLAEVYRAANDMNQAQRNFSGFGIKLPNDGAQYIVKVGRERIDMTKPEHIQRVLMRPPASPFARTDGPFLR